MSFPLFRAERLMQGMFISILAGFLGVSGASAVALFPNGRGGGAFSAEVRFGLLANPELILAGVFKRAGGGLASAPPRQSIPSSDLTPLIRNRAIT